MIMMWPKSGCGQPGGRFAVIFSSSAGGGLRQGFFASICRRAVPADRGCRGPGLIFQQRGAGGFCRGAAGFLDCLISLSML